MGIFASIEASFNDVEEKMGITQDLARFYSKEAKKYHQTRQKPWADGQHFLFFLKKLGLEKPRILELGCGGARFLSYLKEQYDGDFEYCGIDVAEGLLHYAKSDHPDQHFVCQDMVSFLQVQKQESRDVIVACASFQHLPSEKERKTLILSAYRALKYGGIIMMTNWACSERFLKKYWKAMFKSAFGFFFSLGQKSWRDVMVPWKSGKSVEYRYYHLFSLLELRELLVLGGFILEQLQYLDKKGNPVADWRKANNSFFCARKAVFLDEVGFACKSTSDS